jgi:hypothetical protein
LGSKSAFAVEIAVTHREVKADLERSRQWMRGEARFVILEQKKVISV